MNKIFKVFATVIISSLVIVFVVKADTINQVITTDTINTLRTTVNHIIGHISDSTSTLGALSNLATTTGNLIVGSGSSGWAILGIGNNGDILTVTSTSNKVTWASSTGTGITSLNGLTGATQTFATSGTGIAISSVGTAHTYTIQDVYLFNSGDVGTGVFDFGGATSFEIPNGSGGTTVDATGEITIDSASSSLNFYDGTREVVLPGETRVGGVTILGTTSTDPKVKILTVRNTALNLTAVSCSVTSGVVDMQLRFGPDISAAGTAVFSATSTCNVSTVSTTVTFAAGTLGVGDMLWYVPPQLSTISSSSAFSVDVFARNRP